MLAVVLWTVAAVNACTPTRYLRSGQLKGTDFVQFYTLGTLAARGDIERFTDFATVHALQVSLVPESEGLFYPTVYGPQIALAFWPLGSLSYERALLTWTALSSLAYMGMLMVVAVWTPSVRPYVGTTAMAALAFPPFWQLVQHGQLSVVALAAIVGAWWALRNRRDFLAGLALGLLAYKPPLLAPVLAVLVLSGSWPVVVGAAMAAVLQILVAGLWVGWTGIFDHAHVLLALPGMASMLAVRPEQMHSLRTFWELMLPWPAVAMVAYGVSAAVIVAMAARAWRRLPDPSLRIAVLVLATVLSAPHLFVYDLVMLAPAWIWLVDGFARRWPNPNLARLLYAGYLAPLAAPFVPFVRVQLATVCFAILFVMVTRRIRN